MISHLFEKIPSPPTVSRPTERRFAIVCAFFALVFHSKSRAGIAIIHNIAAYLINLKL
jgi:hypothetical protein